MTRFEQGIIDSPHYEAAHALDQPMQTSVRHARTKVYGRAYPGRSLIDPAKTWMPGTRAGMTNFIGLPRRVE